MRCIDKNKSLGHRRHNSVFQKMNYNKISGNGKKKTRKRSILLEKRTAELKYIYIYLYIYIHIVCIYTYIYIYIYICIYTYIYIYILSSNLRRGKLCKVILRDCYICFD